MNEGILGLFNGIHRDISHDFAERSENKTEMLNCKTLKTMGKNETI